MNRELAIETIIIEELKDSVETFLHEHKLSIEEKHTLRSLLEVISYYSIHQDYQTYYEKNKAAIQTALDIGKIAPNTFTVTCVEENLDGSANIEVELGAGVRDQLSSEGLNFLLIKGIVGGTTDDVLRWAQRGKEQENTDNIMRRFSETRLEEYTI